MIYLWEGGHCLWTFITEQYTKTNLVTLYQNLAECSLFLMAHLYVLKLSLFITLCLAMALYGISSDVAKRMLEITMS